MPTAAQLSENSHQGFDGIRAALCLGSMEAKSNTASGMPVCLWREGTGSRSPGKERDAETGLDYFLFRNHSGAEGRFLSPDPENFGAHASNPQSWNGYSYVLNSPLRYVDPLGLAPGDCYLDGVNLPCSSLGAWIRNGAGVVIPNEMPLSYYDGGNFKFLFAGAEALAYVRSPYLSSLTEWNGRFYTENQMKDVINERMESQKKLLATLYSAASGKSYADVYKALSYDNTVGGNSNFRWDSTIDPPKDLAGLSNSRMPGMPSIHLKPRGNEFRLHVDTANPASMIPLGVITHGLADVVFGNINGSIPILR